MRVSTLAALVAAAPLAAQTTFPYSRLDFGNAYRIDRADEFPNARSTSGNVAGDFVWKAFPKEVLARDRTTRVSGLRISFRIDKAYTGSFPVFVTLPQVGFFPLVTAKVGGKDFDVPDLTRQSARVLPLPAIRSVRGGVQTWELRLGPQPDPRLRAPVSLAARDAKGALQGWAVALLAPPGEKLGDGQPHFVPVPSFGEVHRNAGRSSYSGIYDAKKKALMPYGTTGAPSNAGELAIELLLDHPTLQVFSDASGGVRNDPKAIETHKGPGAYDSGLATAVTPGWFGLYCQWESREKDGLVCLPLVTAFGTKMPSATLPVGAARLTWDSARAGLLTAFLDSGHFGVLGVYKKGGVAGHAEDQNGVYVTPRIPLPNDKSLSGLAIWVQALVLDPKGGAAETNLVRIAF